MWIKHLTDGKPPAFTEIGEAVDRTSQAVSAWRRAERAPPEWELHEALARYFGADERWLIRGEGEPPNPELFAAWEKARRRQVREITELEPVARSEKKRKTK